MADSAERRYRESEKKIHATPYVDPGEAAVDLPQDIIRQGGDLILLKRPVTWSYPNHPDYTGKWPAFSPPGGAGVGGHHYAAGGADNYGGGHGGGGAYGIGGGPYGSAGGGYRGGSVGATGVGSSAYHRGGGGSVAGSEGGGGGYYSGVNSVGGVGGGAYANSDYAATGGVSGGGLQGREYPVSIKRSASHGDSTLSSAFTPAISSGDYPGGAGVGGSSSNYQQVQKYAGLNAFPVSPADARLSPWGSTGQPGSPAGSAVVPGATTTTTSYKRLYQEQTSKRMTSNGAVTMDEYQRKQNKESGQYYS